MKLITILLLMCLMLTGCAQAAPQQAPEGSQADPDHSSLTQEEIPETQTQYTPLDTGDMFSNRDTDPTYTQSQCTHITLSDEAITVTGKGASVSEYGVTITQAGSYLLRGSLSDGMILVDASGEDKLQLILDGVSIHSQSCAPIYIRQADKVFITLSQGSENSLSNGGSFQSIDDSSIDSVIFSRDDLTLNGEGALSIQSPGGHGIVSKDDLRICGGSYRINALSHGLQANDSVRICAGELDITAQKDGIHAENDQDADLGFVYISGGSFQVTATGDGISAGSSLQIDAGSFTLECGGGSENAQTHTDDFFGGGRPGGPGDRYTQQQTQTQSDTVSAKGLKSTGPMYLNGGSFTIDTADDAIHSNQDLTVQGGHYTLSTGDDGFHADETLLIRDGDIQITESYEGIEGLTITVEGGSIRLKASDDGLNAAGGNDSSGFGGPGGRPGGFPGDRFGNSESYILISGGELFVDAQGDGIDSNGDLTVTGGYIQVEGPTGGGNGPLDYGGSGTISGGTLLISGSADMAQSLKTTGQQGLLAVSVGSCPAQTQVTVTDSQGNAVITLCPQKQFGCVILSSPALIKGETYTLQVGAQAKDFQAG